MENSCPASRVAPAWIIPSRAFTSFTTREVRDPDCSASKRWMGSRRSLEYARDRMSDDEVRETAALCDAHSTEDLLLVPGQEQECTDPIFYHIPKGRATEPVLPSFAKVVLSRFGSRSIAASIAVRCRVPT